MDLSTKILSDIVIFNKYAKHDSELKRRENWKEIVERNKYMHMDKHPKLTDEINKVYNDYVLPKKVLSSMRSFQFAGKPISLNNSRLYNCCYLPIDDYRAFSEVMFLLLSGVGVGYSVQNEHISNLPAIHKPLKFRRYVIGDSIEGWADAIKVLFKAYMQGKPAPRYIYDDIRPKGASLITSGGKAPGPQPLKDCIHNLKKVLDSVENGEQLTSLQVHDIVCYIADAVLAGGIRRSACLVLFDIDDEAMITCKYGNWWELNPQRARANNSINVIRSKITEEVFFNLWEKIKASGTGDPGIYFSNNSNYGTNPCCFTGDTLLLTKDGQKTFKELAKQDEIELYNYKGELHKGKVWSTGIRGIIQLKTSSGDTIKCTPDHIFMTDMGLEVQAQNLIGKIIKNIEGIRESPVKQITYLTEPEEVFDFNIQDNTHWGVINNGYVAHNCEISLRAFQKCNLTEVNMTDVISQQDFNGRVKAASFLGTLQASITDFHYLRGIWQKTTEKDALIGVGATGIASNTYLNLNLKEGAEVVKQENERVAKLTGINIAKRTTCVKPSGTSSCVVGSSSGIHAWHADHYIRRMGIKKDASLYLYLKNNHPYLVEDDFFKPNEDAHILIPQKAPKGAVVKTTETALQLLERVKHFYNNWIVPGHRKGDNTNNISCTVNIKDNEWDEVGKWMWDNRNNYNGLAVFPHFGGTHKHLPFEEIDEIRYEEMFKKLKEVDLTKVIENNDDTDLQGEVACAGGSCEIL